VGLTLLLLKDQKLGGFMIFFWQYAIYKGPIGMIPYKLAILCFQNFEKHYLA